MGPVPLGAEWFLWGALEDRLSLSSGPLIQTSLHGRFPGPRVPFSAPLLGDKAPDVTQLSRTGYPQKGGYGKVQVPEGKSWPFLLFRMNCA